MGMNLKMEMKGSTHMINIYTFSIIMYHELYITDSYILDQSSDKGAIDLIQRRP